MGWKKEEMFKNIINASTKNKEGKKKQPKKDLILRGGERVYVLFHMVITFPTSHVERSPLKAPASENTAPYQQKEKSKDENGLEKKKEERALYKNRINSADRDRREIEAAKKKDPILKRGEERVYVLDSMFITFPTCQAERLPLKAPASQNTAPHSTKEKFKDKSGLEKRRGESIVQI